MAQVQDVLLLLVDHRQAKVTDAARQVTLHQNVFRLDVPVSDGWFTAVSDNFCVKVGQASSCRVHQAQHLLVIQRVFLEVVVEGAQRVVVGDEPKLGARVPGCHVGAVVAQDVFVSQQTHVVDGCLS